MPTLGEVRQASEALHQDYQRALAASDAAVAAQNGWQLVRFWDDIYEDEPVQFYRARRERNRWVVDGADDWRYDTVELAFYGPYDEARDRDLVARG